MSTSARAPILDRLSRPASWILRGQEILWALVVVLVAGFVYAVFAGARSDVLAGLAVGAVWILSLLWFAHLFETPVVRVTEEDRGVRRVFIQARRAIRGGLMIAVVALLALVVILTFRVFVVVA